ncbi:MAG: hypothetical protein A3B79_01775 [Deltaproteobacteria bacterium RIFCSPHIGHO2_02_FULL_50_15]|nr:MAG: hypothetical protein A3B79_01775 [Deltaproteobacteria bacterium RIFCSPHIGHO2_02_FULL_50_15]
MSYTPRLLQLGPLLSKKSFFLLGPRATGKTTLIRHQLSEIRLYDLLDSLTFTRLLKNPRLIEEENRKDQCLIVVDEIQKLPSLLDEVHRLIEKYDWKFLLTGSSARKLKRGAANLLGGRARMAHLFPLTSHEIEDFDLLRYLNHGGLPAIYLSEEPQEDLAGYVSLYLKEEIQAESLTRNLPAFSTFLDAIALSNGEEINMESFASDCGVSPITVKNYLQILEDTLVGFSLPGFRKTKKRKAISRIKHYLFDVGVVNHLCQRGLIQSKSELFGKAFEQFLIQEVRACLDYQRTIVSLSYWRSTSQFEVDLILGQKLALEIKATSLVQDKHLKGLRALKEEGLIEKYAIVSLDEEERTTEDGIAIYPWKVFLKKMWDRKIV